MRVEAVAFDPATAIAAAARALELAALAGAEEARVDTTISLAAAHGYRGEPAGHAAAGADAAAAGLHIQVVRSYVNELAAAADARDHATVDALAPEAIASFEERGLATPAEYISVLQARSLFDRGRWDEALERAEASRRGWHGGVSVALMVEGLVSARRGQDGGARLAEAGAVLAGVPEGARHGLIQAALAEAAWLRGDRAAQREHALAGLRAANAEQFARSAGDLALWAARAGEAVTPSPLVPTPARLELTGDWRGAIAAWRELEAPYEAALAALPGDDRAAREAVAALHRLGATAAARAFARDRAEQGAAALRGPRRSTLTNPAGLTRREQEVLGHVAVRAAREAGLNLGGAPAKDG